MTSHKRDLNEISNETVTEESHFAYWVVGDSEGDAIALHGYRGPHGEKESRGIAGPVGSKGNVRRRGTQGPEGPPGKIGKMGPVGSRCGIGSRGEKGDKGDTGNVGQQEPAGPQGNTGHLQSLPFENLLKNISHLYKC